PRDRRDPAQDGAGLFLHRHPAGPGGRIRRAGQEPARRRRARARPDAARPDHRRRRRAGRPAEAAAGGAVGAAGRSRHHLVGLAVRATAAITLLAGFLVLAGAIIAGHHRRVYDAVLLKVLGATRRRLALGFALEYGLLGLISAGLAAVLGSLAAYGFVAWAME